MSLFYSRHSWAPIIPFNTVLPPPTLLKSVQNYFYIIPTMYNNTLNFHHVSWHRFTALPYVTHAFFPRKYKPHGIFLESKFKKNNNLLKEMHPCDVCTQGCFILSNTGCLLHHMWIMQSAWWALLIFCPMNSFSTVNSLLTVNSEKCTLWERHL